MVSMFDGRPRPPRKLKVELIFTISSKSVRRRLRVTMIAPGIT
jgi:hypothetical protein